MISQGFLGPKSNGKCSHWRLTEESHMGRREVHVKTKVETGIIHPQAKECLSHEKRERARKDTCFEPLKRAGLC